MRGVLRRTGLRVLAFGWGIVLTAAAAPAQQWIVDASAGGARYQPVAAQVDSRSAMLGIRRQGPRWLYLSAAAPLGSDGSSWAAGGLGGRWTRTLGAVDLGIDAGTHLFGYRDVVRSTLGGGLTLDALPFVALSHGASRMELRSGLRHSRLSDGDSVLSRSVHDSGARFTFSPRLPLRLSGEARWVRAEEGTYPFTQATAEVLVERGSVWGYWGHWMSESIPTPVWGVGGSLQLGRRFEVHASYTQHSQDPLYWNPARRNWNIGVSRVLGAARVLPSPQAVAPVTTGGGVVLEIPISEAAEAPAVGGDFNGWQPVSMQQDGSMWRAVLPIEPGVYRFAFRRADGSWFVPASYPNRVDDGFGGESAVLVVPAEQEP